MATKLYIKLQTPIIELTVKAKDVSGAKESIIVGFKRYETKESQEKISKLQDLLTDSADTNSVSISLDTFIKGEIEYIRQARLELADSETGRNTELTIADTKTAKPNDSLWATPDECLAVLLDLYLSSAPWRLSLILALQKALFNNDYSDAEIKN
jgi:hypothetical protein